MHSSGEELDEREYESVSTNGVLSPYQEEENDAAGDLGWSATAMTVMGTSWNQIAQGYGSPRASQPQPPPSPPSATPIPQHPAYHYTAGICVSTTGYALRGYFAQHGKLED